MMIKRNELWGNIIYNTRSHTFEFEIRGSKELEPYPTKPLVLNIDLTFKCNMRCIHCVAEDMARVLGGAANSDLEVTNKLIKNINRSPFLVMVITGGEPLLHDYEKPLYKLINGIDNKGIIIDTNGTIQPSRRILNIIKSKEIMIRVSWDIPHPTKEVKLRKYPDGLYESDLDCMNAKEEFIKCLRRENIKVAIQTVFHSYNLDDNNLLIFPYKLKELGIKDWFIQRFIPSHHVKNKTISSDQYNRRVDEIAKIADQVGITVRHKKDRRHNSVFLLVKDGVLYTQSDTKPGEKICLGKIGEVDYFAFVSAPDHSARYIA